jgi:hypothetical protein
MSLKIKVSKKIKNQCESDRTIKSQIEIKKVLCDTSRCSGVEEEIKEKINCFWDRNRINGPVIRCPLRYKPKQIVKVYKSEISKEEYTIKENVVKFPCLENKKKEPGTNDLQTIQDVLEVTDAFCSFNCCLAWIRDNKHDRRYDQSEILLHKIFRDISNSKILNPSPHWRTLIEYGGTMSIEEFRDQTTNVEFTYRGPILDNVYLFSKKFNIC